MENINQNYIRFLRRLFKEYNVHAPIYDSDILMVLDRTNLNLYKIINNVLIELLIDVIHQEINNKENEDLFYELIQIRYGRQFNDKKSAIKFVISGYRKYFITYSEICYLAIFWDNKFNRLYKLDMYYWENIYLKVKNKFSELLSNCMICRKYVNYF